MMNSQNNKHQIQQDTEINLSADINKAIMIAITEILEANKSQIRICG